MNGCLVDWHVLDAIVQIETPVTGTQGRLPGGVVSTA